MFLIQFFFKKYKILFQASFFESASKAKKELGRQRTLDAQYPFVGAAVGILVAVAVVVYDYVANAPGQSYIGHPLLKASFSALSIFCRKVIKGYWIEELVSCLELHF